MSTRLAEEVVGASSTGEATKEPPRQKEEQQNPPANDNINKEGNEDENDEDENDKAPQPPFEPLFTLLTNTTTNTTIHPRVQYIFTDDDPSVISAPLAPSSRAVVVDLSVDPSATGSWKVSWAASLSADFAISDARMLSPSSAPSTSGAGVLRLDGVEREPVDPPPPLPPPLSSDGLHYNSDADAGDDGLGHPGDDLQALAEDFRRRMAVLRSVVAEADRRVAATKMQDDLPSAEHQQKKPEKGTADDEAPIIEDAQP
ncbi:hypothetical protein CP533_5442 [Ophiocordyceps camponoti-saundersi (nom. inval.)]|nr:hypothetical protein CP533_5442 [Ophiocordyceps camponoti-saundersi (nom. inval.)]